MKPRCTHCNSKLDLNALLSSAARSGADCIELKGCYILFKDDATVIDAADTVIHSETITLSPQTIDEPEKVELETAIQTDAEEQTRSESFDDETATLIFDPEPVAAAEKTANQGAETREEDSGPEEIQLTMDDIVEDDDTSPPAKQEPQTGAAAAGSEPTEFNVDDLFEDDDTSPPAKGEPETGAEAAGSEPAEFSVDDLFDDSDDPTNSAETDNSAGNSDQPSESVIQTEKCKDPDDHFIDELDRLLEAEVAAGNDKGESADCQPADPGEDENEVLVLEPEDAQESESAKKAELFHQSVKNPQGLKIKKEPAGPKCCSRVPVRPPVPPKRQKRMRPYKLVALICFLSLLVLAFSMFIDDIPVDLTKILQTYF